MKRMMAMGVIALAVLAFTGQQASAWCKFGFGVGLNVNWECGGNSFLWGAYKSGPPPGAYQPYPVPVPVPGFADHGPAPAFHGPEFAPAYEPAHAPAYPATQPPVQYQQQYQPQYQPQPQLPQLPAPMPSGSTYPQSGSTPVGWWGATGYYWQGN